MLIGRRLIVRPVNEGKTASHPWISFYFASATRSIQGSFEAIDDQERDPLVELGRGGVDFSFDTIQ
jgi:hypothetical protein